MKIVHESVFISSLRAFLVAFFGVIGAMVGLMLVALLIFGIASKADDDTLSSKVKILPDANGSRKELGSSKPAILQINLQGTIGKENLTWEKIEEILLDSRESDFKNDRVKGVLLMINSPGGSANDADIIYRHLKEYKERYKVPVYAFINGMCASGGYYIACSADKIYASDVSLVGSIGVIAWPPFVNVYDALEKLGVSALTLFSGKGKDEMNPFREWGKDESEQYQQLLNFYYANFVEIVSKDRHKVDKNELVEKLGAKLFPAPEALALGLIDVSNSSRNAALRDLAQEIGIEEYQVVTYESGSWLKRLFQEQSHVKHELVFPNMKHPLNLLTNSL